MKILKTVKLDKKNKLILINKDGMYKVISVKRILFGLAWIKSEYALDYQTSLDGKKIVDGDYNEFKTKSNAVKWMNYLTNNSLRELNLLGVNTLKTII